MDAPDDRVWGDQFTTLRARFPHTPPGLPTQLVLFYHYSIKARQHVPFIKVLPSGKKKWMIKRDPLNSGRGDMASTELKKHSMVTVGLLQLGDVAWLFTAALYLEFPMELTAMHFAGRCEGLEQAWEEDKDEANEIVQSSVARGLLNARVFTKRAPPECQIELKDLGNATNTIVTEVTLLELWGSSFKLKASFKQFKEDNGFSIDNNGQGELERLELAHVMAMRPRKFRSYRVWEACVKFYNNTSKWYIKNSGPDGSPLRTDCLPWFAIQNATATEVQVFLRQNKKPTQATQATPSSSSALVPVSPMREEPQLITFWDYFAALWMKNVDPTRKDQDDGNIMTTAAQIVTSLRDHPTDAIHCLFMILPLVASVGFGFPLLKKGLSNPAVKSFTDVELSRLHVLMDASESNKLIGQEQMRHDKVVKELNDEEKLVVEKQALSVSPEVMGHNFLHAVQNYLEDMLKYDADAKHFAAIRSLMLRGQTKLALPLDNSVDTNKVRFVRKMSMARTIFKTWLIRVKKLQPRVSDADINLDDFNKQEQDDTPETFDPEQHYTTSQVVSALEEFAGALVVANEFFSAAAAAPKRPVSQLPASMHAVNKVMMTGMMFLSTATCEPGSGEFVEALMTAAYEEADRVMPVAASDGLAKFEELMTKCEACKDRFSNGLHPPSVLSPPCLMPFAASPIWAPGGVGGWGF